MGKQFCTFEINIKYQNLFLLLSPNFAPSDAYFAPSRGAKIPSGPLLGSTNVAVLWGLIAMNCRLLASDSRVKAKARHISCKKSKSNVL